MRKFYALSLNQKNFLLWLVCFFLAINVKAQTDISIGTGTTGNAATSYPAPLQDWYEGSRAQYLYTAAELSAAGMVAGNLRSIKFNVTNLNTFTGSIQQLVLKIGSTTTTSLSTSSTTWEATTALYGPVDYVPTLGINTFTFTTPFFWNGTSNIVVEVCNGLPANITDGLTHFSRNVTIPWTTGLSFNGSHTIAADNNGNLCTSTIAGAGITSTETSRPNITFNWDAALVCSGTPVAGTALSTAANVCLGQSFTLSLSGATIASGLTYQWQSSPDNTNWTNISGATFASLTTSQSSTTYYRAVVTCSIGGATATSSSVLVSSPTLVSGVFDINKDLPTNVSNKTFNSFNDAYNYIKCGINGPVTFNVVSALASGAYNEQLIMQPVPGASSTNAITFNGSGRTISFTSTNTNERAVIKLDGADHVKFNNVTITAGGTTTTQYGFGVHLINDADSNSVSGCTINITAASTSTQYAGIVMSASATSATGTGSTLCDDNVFINNTITGGYYGIILVGSTTEAVRTNKIIKNTIQDFYSYGVYLNGNYNTLVDSNRITRPTRTTVTTTYGVYLTSLNVSCYISRNRIYNLFGGAATSTSTMYGIYSTGVDALGGLENKVVNNAIYNTTSNGDMYGIYTVGSDNIWFHHNTIVLDGTSIAAGNITRGFYQTTAAGGVEFKNNIVYISRGGTAAKHGLYFNTATSSIVSNNNDIYFANQAAYHYTGAIGTTNYLSLADWRAASSQDLASVSANPAFANPLIGDYAPTSTAVNNTGAPLGIMVDINNSPRSASTPDMGAWEFAPLPCVTPPVPGNAAVSPVSVCVGVPVSFTLTGNSFGLTQTYQWQTSSTINGTFINIGVPLTNPDTTMLSSTTLYYRVAVTCGANTTYTAPVLLTVSQRMPGGTYTITKNPTNYTGSAGANFNGFNAAWNALQCGVSGPVVFNVVSGSGPYDEQLIMDTIPGASAVNTVTFKGNLNIIRFGSANTDERAVIKLRRTDYVTFDSLVVTALETGTYGWGIQLINNADSNTFRNCVINTSTVSTSTNFAGIVISASDNAATTTGNTWCDANTFENNTVNGGYYSITLVGSTTALPNRNNKIIGNRFSNFYMYGVYLAGTFNTLVEGNTISRPTRTAVGNFYGIYGTGISTKLLVTKNRIHSPFDAIPTTLSDFYGIYFTGVSATVGAENIISNNAIYNVTGNSDVYGIYNSGSDFALYYHNTISLDNQSSSYSSADWSRGFYQITEAAGIQFKNNMVSVTRVGSGTRHAIYMATDATQYESNYNNLYVAGPASTSFIGYDGTNRSTLANWQAATNQDANSKSAAAMFASPATGDLRPRNPSLDNMGTPVGITTDILNAARSATQPDAGAWEFAIPACTTPPAAGAATATPSTGICMGAPVLLTLSGINPIVSGQTYQWQYSTSASGPWSNLGGPLLFPDTTIMASVTLYYRAIVNCSGQQANSTPVLVSLNPALLSGFYTIKPGSPASATNYQSFTTAVAALNCGITGFVTFLVDPGTYNEQIIMKPVAGSGPNSRITFQSVNGTPSSVVLTFAGTSTNNYTLKLDSSSYVTYKNLTVNATNTTNGRAIEVAGNSSYDSLLNLTINVPVSSGTSNALAGIYAGALTGTNNVIKANTVNNGSSGIYYAGASTTAYTARNVIDSNTINNAYYYGIYVSSSFFSSVTRNMIKRNGPTNATAYGIYLTNVDSAYQVVGNRISISNTGTATEYGLYMTGNGAQNTVLGRVANNHITAITGIAGTVYGLYQTASTYNLTINNVISIKTTGASSYALYGTGGTDIKYYNNTVYSAATSATNNFAAYLAHSTNAGADVRNNIFAHGGGGRAMYIGSDGFISSDYNMYYTTGSTLFQRGTPAGTFNTLDAWTSASGWDQSSIVFKPAFANDSTLVPDIGDSTVWAMHGRGVQIAGNNADHNNNPRPVTLTTGVPDLGAYEFLPTVAPMPLQGNPVAPAANTTQVFMLGTDTVSKITWKAGSVPSGIVLRRYSGVLPPGTTASQQSMYFYVKTDVTGTNTPQFDLKQFYIDSWQGFIPREAVTRLGRTNAANTWIVDASSSVDSNANVISQATLNFIDRFTGLTDATIAPPPPPIYVQQIDSSNRGKRFWVAYAHSYDFFSGSNSQNMVLYLGTGNQPATVTVRITGTSWVRTYNIPANRAITSDIIPKTGINDARLLIEGISSRGILIESDVPISAYAHIYSNSNSGATMLLPVGVYGYEYYTLNSRQHYTTANSHSSFFVIADRDNTKVEITPSNPTSMGKPSGVPFTVTLNAGDSYQILGAYIGGSEGYDMTGSLIKTVPNSDGKCYPIAVFAGSTRTYITCGAATASGGDVIFQQVFPSQAWGTKYLTAPTSADASASTLMTNIYRVMVKDPTTNVTVNGQPITTLGPLTGNRYYQFTSGTADYIQADKPIMVAQYMPSSGSGCANTSGDGDPEMFYLSPVEQAIKSTQFYRNDLSAIDLNYATLIIPTTGLASLLIDGANTFDHTYPHPNRPGYTVVVKRFAAGTGFSTVVSDSAFTGIVYGLGSVESYGYNIGTLVKNLNAIPSITNVLSNNNTQPSSYTCQNAPFRFNILLPLKPTRLTWQFSQVAGLTPNADVIQNTPAIQDSTFINGRWYYRYTVLQDYRFSGTGSFNVPILISHPTIEGCNNSYEQLMTIDVKPAPNSDFTINFSGCIGTAAQFTGSGSSTIGGVTVTGYNWTFGDNTTGTGQSVSHIYAAANTYNVKLNVVTSDGCLGETIKPLVVNARPVVTLVRDTVTTCPNTQVTLQVQNPATGATYNWYSAATGGSLVHTGTSYPVTVAITTSFYVEATQLGCASTTRTQAVVNVLSVLTAPTIQITDRTPNSITFGWNQVPGATGYEVSTNNGTTWTTPSSGTGPSATTHQINGMAPLTSVTLLVRALGGCVEARSQPVTGQALTDQVFIPNSFSPNGDGLNDVIKVYGHVIKGMQFMVYNQWGEKIYESRDQNNGWDGTYKGKAQPSGVYIYVVRLTLNDGSVMDKKGTINLVR